MKQLEVYFNDIKAGILSEQHPGTGYSFQYDEEYLKICHATNIGNFTKESHSI